MELNRDVEEINRQLIDFYGVDTVTGQAMWRVVWSEDQFEHRYGTYDDYTSSGIYLRTVTEVRYVKKYPWIRDRYVLEDLVVIPEINAGDLPATKMSYEPKYPFQTKNGSYAPPTILAARWVIDCILAVKGKGTLSRYKDKIDEMKVSSTTAKEYYAMRNEELNELEKELFGNETDTGDAMAHGEAIIVPRNYQRES